MGWRSAGRWLRCGWRPGVCDISGALLPGGLRVDLVYFYAGFLAVVGGVWVVLR